MRGKPFNCTACERSCKEPGLCNTCIREGTPLEKLEVGTASARRCAIIFTCTAIAGGVAFAHFIQPHPTLHIYMEVDGSLGVCMLSLSLIMRFMNDYFERRDEYRLEVCKQVHDR